MLLFPTPLLLLVYVSAYGVEESFLYFDCFSYGLLSAILHLLPNLSSFGIAQSSNALEIIRKRLELLDGF